AGGAVCGGTGGGGADAAEAGAAADAGARKRPGGRSGKDANAVDATRARAMHADLDSPLGRLGPLHVPRAAVPTPVPVYVHVLHSGEAGRLAQGAVDAHIDHLNATYGGQGE
ncbi:hypothetical protein VM98_36645, partial [Streptomyces rubellomurinus subsp. indigoferus]